MASNFRIIPSSSRNAEASAQTRARTCDLQTVPSSKHGTFAGKVGLKNLGNTCFMNAGLQCLSHLEPLVQHFLSGAYLQEIMDKGDTKIGEVAKAFAELQRLMWEGNSDVLNPRKLRQKLATRNPWMFDGYEQQDVQEFLAFCLDGLHEDLNRVKEKPAPLTEEEAAEEETVCMDHGEEFVATLYWIRHLMHGRSFLVDLLQGQLRSKTECVRCGYESRHFEPFLYLSLPVAKSMVNLTDALDAFLEAELLEGDNGWWCPQCQSKGSAHRKMDLWKLPPVLVVHLKRFEFCSRTFNFRKLNVHLQTPESVDLSPYCNESVQKSGAQYLVSCVANHIGPFGSGHYTATCRMTGSVDRSWYHFDDERVRKLQKNEEPVSERAYVLFLVRTEVNGRDGLPATAIRAPRRQTLAIPENWPHKASSRNSVMAKLLNTGAAATALLTAKDHALAQELQRELEEAETVEAFARQKQEQEDKALAKAVDATKHRPAAESKVDVPLAKNQQEPPRTTTHHQEPPPRTDRHQHNCRQQQQHQLQHPQQQQQRHQFESEHCRNQAGRLQASPLPKPERQQHHHFDVEQCRNQAGRLPADPLPQPGLTRREAEQAQMMRGYPKGQVAQPFNAQTAATATFSANTFRVCPSPSSHLHRHQHGPQRNQSAPGRQATQQQHRVRQPMTTANDLHNPPMWKEGPVTYPPLQSFLDPRHHS